MIDIIVDNFYIILGITIFLLLALIGYKSKNKIEKIDEIKFNFNTEQKETNGENL